MGAHPADDRPGPVHARDHRAAGHPGVDQGGRRGGILYQAIVPQPAPTDWPAEACWAYHGVPQHLVLTEDGRLPGIPVCPPETLVIDYADLRVMPT